MRLLFVAKREPQQRDLVTRPYGRFHFLSSELARLGHEVHMLLVSHSGSAATNVVRERMCITTFNPRKDGLRQVLVSLEAHTRMWSPDWVIGCSDAWYGWLAHRLARCANAALAIDAYDNYEAYMRWNFPLHWQWRRSIRAADLVIAAGPQLAGLLNGHRIGQRPTEIIPMSADPAFVPRDARAAREFLNLPREDPLVGYLGGWASNRGTDVLLKAFRLVRRSRPKARLVLTGTPPARALAEPGALPVGYLPDADMPTVLSAVNVACVITANSAFGRYSYPVKLCEAMACEVPVVATATEPVRWMLHDNARFLAPVGNARAVAARIVANMDLGRTTYPSMPGWNARAAELDALLREKP